MPDYRIVEVETRRDLRKFVRFPDELYRNCRQYVPALHADQYYSLTKASTLKYCRRKMWLALDGKGKVAGRICGMINSRYNELYDRKRARFGWFDTIEDFQVAKLLLGTAEDWARSEGMTEIHGPLYYNTLGKQGMLVEGFENIPPFNCLYNFPYYNDYVLSLGYTKELDWLQYKVPANQGAAEKVERVAKLVTEKYKLHEADIDKMKKDKNMVMKFFKVYNDSFSSAVANFIPFTPEEVEEETNGVIKLLSNKTSSIILDENDDVVAFGITFPVISPALQKCKGHLFPFGWFHLMRALRDNRIVDLMLNGAAPSWQNKGVSAVYHCAMAQRYIRNGTEWAITNPQIEGNSAVNVWNKYDSTLYMRRRCYLKSL